METFILDSAAGFVLTSCASLDGSSREKRREASGRGEKQEEKERIVDVTLTNKKKSRQPIKRQQTHTTERKWEREHDVPSSPYTVCTDIHIFEYPNTIFLPI
jgi:hypothetical protein